ncbi:MAG TPA: hypothetical protein VK213_07575 [Bacteroidales bacterium]|nr:hypothetical protein [Bacteroidales bacterium]
MKTRLKSTAAAILIILLTISFIACNKFLSASEKKIDLTGTWELDSYKYGNTDLFDHASIKPKRIKVITENTFMWVSYDTASHRLYSSAGGAYTLDNDNYTESIDFGLGMDKYLGTKSIYKVKSEDDMLFITGELSDGLHIEEVWRKIK